MADSVGQGIGLGERFKYDTTSGTDLLNKAVQGKIAADKKAEDDFVTNLDFKVDYSKTLPVYGKEMTKVASGLINKYHQYKKEDPRTARNRVEADAYQARMELGRLQRDNDAALKYVNQPAGMLRDDKFIGAVTSMDTNIEDLPKYNDGYFLNIGNRGEFAFRPAPEIKPATIVKYDDKDYTTIIRGTKASKVPGKMEVEYYDDVIPDAVRRNAEALMATPGFVDNVVYANPALKQLPEKERLAAAFDAAFDISTKLKRSGKSDWKLADLPNPSGSSDKDKREKPVVVKNTQQTISEPTGEVEVDKDLEGKVRKTPKKENRESVIPLSVAVAKTPAQTIPMDSRMIDATTNEYFKGEDLNQNVVFKPDQVITTSIKKSGKWEKYVLGTATVNKIDKNDVKTEKIITMLVPYDKVQSSIEGAYDLSEFDAEFNELQKTPYKKKEGAPAATPSSQPTKTVIAPNNSVGVKPEM